jgi:pilus assembly protein Flp/PilA
MRSKNLIHHGRKGHMLQHFLVNDDGQGLVEYALIIVLVAIAFMGALRLFGNKTGNMLTNEANVLL